MTAITPHTPKKPWRDSTKLPQATVTKCLATKDAKQETKSFMMNSPVRQSGCQSSSNPTMPGGRIHVALTVTPSQQTSKYKKQKRRVRMENQSKEADKMYARNRITKRDQKVMFPIECNARYNISLKLWDALRPREISSSFCVSKESPYKWLHKYNETIRKTSGHFDPDILCR